MWPLSVCIEALVHVMDARIKNLVNIMLYFLENTKTVVHQNRIVFLRLMIAGLCIPKVFLSWSLSKPVENHRQWNDLCHLSQIPLL